MIYSYIKLIRLKHWVKNLLIFTAFFLSKKEFSATTLKHLILAFFSFGLLASCVYIFNDILDQKSDRNHPIKKHRPIASGVISIQKAWLYLSIMFIAAFSILLFIPYPIVYYLYGLYLLINLSYTFILKKKKYLDIICLVSFYIIRILIGSKIDNTLLTPIFILCCITVFTSLSLSKRLGEIYLMRDKKILNRAYSTEDTFLLHTASIVSAFITLLLFNLHNIFFLKITDYSSVIIINFLGIYIILSFFDLKKETTDDPVSKILNSKKVLLASILFAAYYLFLLNR